MRLYTSTYGEALAFSDSDWQLVNDCWPRRRRGGGGGPARGIAGGEGSPWGSACGSEHGKGTPECLRRRARRTEITKSDMRWKMHTLTTKILTDGTHKHSHIPCCCLFDWSACKYELCFHSCNSLYKVLTGDTQSVIRGAVDLDR